MKEILYRLIAVDDKCLNGSSPNERGKFTLILVMLVILIILTGISGWYMLYLNFQSNFIALTMGFLMAMVFANLYLVTNSTFKYPEKRLQKLKSKPNTISDKAPLKFFEKILKTLNIQWRDFGLSSIMRIFILSFLGLFFTIPLCLLIFQKQLSAGAEIYREELTQKSIRSLKNTLSYEAENIKNWNNNYLRQQDSLEKNILKISSILEASVLSHNQKINYKEDLEVLKQKKEELIQRDSASYLRNKKAENRLNEKLKLDSEKIKAITSKSAFFIFRVKSLFVHNSLLAVFALLFGMLFYISPLLIRLSMINNYLKHFDEEINEYDYLFYLSEKKGIEKFYNENKIKYKDTFNRLMREGKISPIQSRGGELIPIEIHSLYLDPPFNTMLKKDEEKINEKGLFIKTL